MLYSIKNENLKDSIDSYGVTSDFSGKVLDPRKEPIFYNLDNDDAQFGTWNEWMEYFTKNYSKKILVPGEKDYEEFMENNKEIKESVNSYDKIYIFDYNGETVAIPESNDVDIEEVMFDELDLKRLDYQSQVRELYSMMNDYDYEEYHED